jgi:hypothetical protein
MSSGRKLIQKVTRRAKKVKESVRGFDQQAKTDKLDEVMKDSPGAYKAMVHPARKADGQDKAGLSTDVVAKEPRLEFKLNATTLERFDYGAGDYGMRLTCPAGFISASRVKVGDVVQVLEGELKGAYLSVAAVTDSTHLRLEDKATYVGPESSVVVRFQLSTQKSSYN